MRQKYRITGSNSMGYPVGTICYRPTGHDYGLASDDSRMTGHPHVSMTLKEDGDYPTFTVREGHLEKVP